MTSNADIVSALRNLAIEEIDRVRLRLWRRFGGQLRNIPEAPSPDDLLHDTIEDLLADRRHCPLERVQLVNCLFNIVRSKVSHVYDKWKKTGIIHEPEDILLRKPVQKDPQVEESALHDNILALVEDDSLLTRIVRYRLEHADEEPLRTQKIADALGVDIKEMYNANRRLKARLERLIKPAQSNEHSKGGTYGTNTT